MPLPGTKHGLVSVSELARRWGITHQSVMRYHVEKGGLNAIQGGGTTWFAVDDVNRYEERLRNEWKGQVRALLRRLKRIEKPLELAA